MKGGMSGNIMKKLKAKNRTEVAYITNQLTGPKNCHEGREAEVQDGA